MIFEYISISSDIAIILLLAIQSWVLVKLLPEIKATARNSDYFTKTLAPKKSIDTRNVGCTDPFNPNHIHTKECF